MIDFNVSLSTNEISFQITKARMIEFLVSLSTSIYLKVAESEEIQVPCCTMIRATLYASSEALIERLV